MRMNEMKNYQSIFVLIIDEICMQSVSTDLKCSQFGAWVITQDCRALTCTGQ